MPKDRVVPWKALEADPATQPQRVILLYGQSGVGKTRLAAQFPKTLLLACDPGELGGAISALDYKPLHVKIDDYASLIRMLPDIKSAVSSGEVETVVVDSISYLARTAMNNILDKVGREIAQQADWGLLQTRLRKLILALTDMPAHVGFTAVDLIRQDEVTGAVFGGPDLPGKLAKELPQACDVVARLTVKSSLNKEGKREAVYKYTVVGDSTYMAKDRTGLMELEGNSNFKAFEKLFI